MPNIYLVNERRFPLQVEDYTNTDLLPYYRWEHRVTVGYMGRRFIIFLDNGIMDKSPPAIYIEEMTTKLEKIEDEELWTALFHWVTEKGFLMVVAPMTKPKSERFV